LFDERNSAMKLYRYILLIVVLALTALAAPTMADASAAGKLATYADPAGLWSVQYPPDLLHVERLNDHVTIFISKDRHSVAAVDTFEAPGDAYGNNGAILRGRAEATLGQIYGKPVTRTGVVKAPAAPWETGIGFKTNKGSKGTAVYEQRGRNQENYYVHGFLYGYKATSESAMLPVLKAMRASFKAGPLDPKGINRARDSLQAFFGALYVGRYADAARLYGGSYEALIAWNLDVSPSDHATLLERGCTHNGLQCLRLKRIVAEQAVSDNEFRFVVEFLNDDGSLFELGPCCGASSGKITTRFPYLVRRVSGEYLVQDLPVYVP
jgi:hypothetical protein